MSFTKLTVTDFSVYYEDSGAFTITMDSKYRAQPISFSNFKIPEVDDPDDPDQIGVSSGEYKFPWGERSDRSELTISSDDVRPFNIVEIEWFGQILSRGTRR